MMLRSEACVGLQPHKNAGFTLVELLAVIVIMAALVALLFPFGVSIYQRALQGACLSNVRSYGIAVFAYVSDEGSLPKWNGTPSEGGGNVTPQFGAWVKPYLNSSKALRCPLVNGHERKESVGFMYSGNASLSQYYPTLMGLPVPANKVVLAVESVTQDGFYIAGHLNRTIWGNSDGSADPSSEGDARRPQYHPVGERRGLNMVFLDGHVELIAPADNDWTKPPTLGDAKNKGYFYHRTQFAEMKKAQ